MLTRELMPVAGSTIAALPTRYGRHFFRSRTEARWAMYLDLLAVRWEYEVEGFHFNGRAYLPDFYFPERDEWGEVKYAGGFTDIVRDLLWHFARESGKRVLMLDGSPRDGQVLAIFPDSTTTFVDLAPYADDRTIELAVESVNAWRWGT
jgi:hypothetical protein